MSRKQIVAYVLVSLVVIAALAVGGYALYRLGYSHGLREVSQLPFEKRLIPDFHHRMLPDLPAYRWYIGFPFFFALTRWLLPLGVIALVVLAVIGIIKTFQPNPRPKDALPEEKSLPTIASEDDAPFMR